MNIWAWLVIGYLALEALVIIGGIGKPRTATTPNTAVIAVVLLAVVAVLVVMAVAS